IDECRDKFTWCASSDAYFFEYPAARNYVGTSAAMLHKFICQIFPHPDPAFFSEDLSTIDWAQGLETKKVWIRKGPYEYHKIVLVGHSLGGFVIRQLIHSEFKRFRDSLRASLPALQWPIMSADLRLISPAHLGFRPGGPLKMLMSIPNIGTLMRILLNYF